MTINVLRMEYNGLYGDYIRNYIVPIVRGVKFDVMSENLLTLLRMMVRWPLSCASFSI